MELIKICWIAIFALFSLTLIYIWSKLYIIARKVKAVDAILGMSEGLDEKVAPPEK
jgi:hypothetical protein